MSRLSFSSYLLLEVQICAANITWKILLAGLQRESAENCRGKDPLLKPQSSQSCKLSTKGFQAFVSGLCRRREGRGRGLEGGRPSFPAAPRRRRGRWQPWVPRSRGQEASPRAGVTLPPLKAVCPPGKEKVSGPERTGEKAQGKGVRAGTK